MKVSVVILNWNGERFLSEYLPSVLKFCGGDNAEVVVADNNSSDNSIELLHNKFQNVKIIQLDQNYGFAGGYNRALSMLKDSEYFVLCNSDVLLKSDAISPIIRIMDSDSNIAVMAPKIKSLHCPDTFEYAGAAGGFVDKFGYPFCRGRIMDTLERDNGQYNDICEIFWASGAFMVVRASIFRELNGLDDSFFAHMEEIDFCWRVKNLGYKVVYCPDAEVFHLGGGTLNQGNPQKVYLNFRNSLWMLMKNLPDNKLFPTIFVRMVLDGVSAMIYILGLKFSYFWAVARAHYSFYCNISRLWRQRKTIEHHIEKLSGMLNGSMVWRYIVGHKKTFNQLYKNS